MGSKFIWIAASFAYGAVSAAIYILVCWRSGRTHLVKRAIFSFIYYTVMALILVRIIWAFMAN